MIEAFRNFFRVCYEHTGEPPFKITVDRRIYDALRLNIESRAKYGCPEFYPEYILLDGVLVYART